MNPSRTVLVVGSGGREHALAWKLSQSAQVSRVIAAPGCGALPDHFERWELNLSAGIPEFEKLADRAIAANVDLVVIGPDQALADGIVDVLSARGILVFGPTQAASQIEASKGFAKEVMQAAGIPTARFFRARSLPEAREILQNLEWGQGWVIKADGLALGKGVQVCLSREEALAAAEELIEISAEIVIEERLSGEESSWLAFCDGERCALLEPARDYKPLRAEGDERSVGGGPKKNPMTGGMGAISPVPLAHGQPDLFEKFSERLRREVFLPTLGELNRRGTPFRGVLFAGLMIEGDRISVLEFNARFGDPETQVLLSRMSDDLYGWLEACARGNIKEFPENVGFRPETAVVVVGAVEGYPTAVKLGDEITAAVVAASTSLLAGSEANVVPNYFFAGLSQQGDRYLTSGGRVLGAMGISPDPLEARAMAYGRLESARFRGMQFRSDIGLDAAAAVVPIAVFASGRGSNFEAILNEIAHGRLRARIVALVSDREDAKALDLARASGIPAICVPLPQGAPREAHEETVLSELKSRAKEWPRFVVLAGYMRKLSPYFLERFRASEGYHRVVNIHPSLLPAFPGMDAYGQAFDQRASKTGATVHLVNEQLDAGPICAQESFSIVDCHSADEVRALGIQVEHRLYSQTLSWILSEKFSVSRNKESIIVSPN